MVEFAHNVRNPEIREAIREQSCCFIEHLILAADDNYWEASFTPTAHASSSITTTLAVALTNSVCPGLPVHLVGVITDDAASASDWTAVSLQVTGIDQFGRTVTETITGVDGGAGAWTCTGAVAWATIIKTVLTITGTVDASDTGIYGFAKTWGLGVAVGATTDVLSSMFDGSADAGTVNAVYSTYTIAGTPDAAKLVSWYVRSSAIN